MRRASTMFMSHTALILRNLLRDFLVLSVVISIALFIWLKIGIKIDSFVFNNYKIDRLYIKLDKKLILKSALIEIPKSKKKPSFDNIDKTFDTIKSLLEFFDYIELAKVSFENNNFSVIFADDILYVSSNDYEIAGGISRDDNRIVAEISMLYLKKNKITLKGRLVYDINTKTLDASGNFKAFNISGFFSAKKIDNRVIFKIDTEIFSNQNLKDLVEALKPKKNIQAWLTDKITASRYQLRGLEGRVNIKQNNIFELEHKSLKAVLDLEDVAIKFNESLEAVLSKKITVEFRDKKVYFEFEKPSYLGRSMKGSRGDISGLLDANTPFLHLDLNMSTAIDNQVQKILKTYALDIPISYTDKDTQLKLKMNIPLDGNRSIQQNLAAKLEVKADEGVLRYRDIVLPLKRAVVTYDSIKNNEIVFKGSLNRGDVKLSNTKFKILSGDIYYTNGKVKLENIHIKEPWYEGRLYGAIDTEAKKAKLSFKAKKISIGGKNKIFLLKNKTLSLDIDFKDCVSVSIPALSVDIKDRKNGLLIQAKKIKKIKSYLRNIPFEINDGTVDIFSHKNNIYTFKGKLHRNSCFLYSKNNQCHTKIPIEGRVSKNKLDFYAFSKRVHYSMPKSSIKIDNINIDIEKFLKASRKIKKTKSKKIIIVGKKSNIRYKKHTLVMDSYDLEIKPNGDIKAYGSLDGDVLKLSIKGKNFSLKALRIKDSMLHPLINFKGLKHGRYTIKQSGNPDKLMRGQIIVEGGILSDFKTYNNTLAFINAIPAIATLSNPGFSEKGFGIKEGIINYTQIKEKIFFDSIYIKGISSTIAGKGEIDIAKKTIKINLAIQTARELGKVVGSLPLVGYILMGKDKSMTLGLKITGTFDKPIVHTSAAEEILTLPLQLIKRTLESPAHILNN